MISTTERSSVHGAPEGVPIRRPSAGGSGDEVFCAHHLFEGAARRTPAAYAAVAGGTTLTYGELNERANRLARALARRGVGPETRVALLMERGAHLPVALLAVLKAGGAYVPVDPEYPAERIAYVLRDSGAALVVADGASLSRMPEGGVPRVDVAAALEEAAGESGDDLPDAALPDSLAYVIYTSGSTGRPKGVAVTHRALVSHNLAAATHYGLGPADRVAQVTSIGFDISVEEIFPTWSAGGTVVFRPAEIPAFGNPFAAWLEREAITVLNLPTAFWHAWVNDLSGSGASLPSALRLVVVGGESALAPTLAEWWRVSEGRVRWINSYGPTETTVTATLHEPAGASPGAGEIPIGRPMGDTRAYVLGPGMAPVGPGGAGELFVGGAGVARGYLGRPSLTAERFLPDAFSTTPGARLYRTGDRARFRPDGEIEFLGRVDDQVKVAGFRVEPGEVESVLSGHPEVAAAAVVAREFEGAGTRLVAYAAPREGARPESGGVRRWLRERLPPYMVPSAVCLVESLPLTAHGKVDRRALPPPAVLEPLSGEGGGPEDGLGAVCQAWAEVLGMRPEVDDDFWELGGHSLLAMRILSRIRQRTGVELPVRALFDAPTPLALAGLLDGARGEAVVAPQPPLAPRERAGEIPQSFAQSRLWFLHRMEPESPAYNIPFAVRLLGELQVDALERALTEIVRRHEALRTVFRDAATGAVQEVRPAPERFPLQVADLRSLPAEWSDAELLRLIADEAETPFDLRVDPMLRGLLVRVSETEHVLCLVLHHIAGDGWSIGLVFREMAALYATFRVGRAPAVPTLPVQYGDYALWQREWLHGEVLEAQLRYWRERLAGAPRLLELPTDRPRPPVQSYRGEVRSFLVEPALAGRLKGLARESGATLFMVLLAGFDLLLHRLSGIEDVVVGSPIAGRVRRETEGLIGFFVNTMALRTDLGGDPSFRELIARVRETTLEAYAHQDLPFERVVEELHPERSLGYQPLFQAAFALQTVSMDPVDLEGVILRLEEVDSGTSKFDLFLEMEEEGDGLRGRLEYATDLWEPATVDRMIGLFVRLLEGAAADPERPVSACSALAADDRERVERWSGRRVTYPRDATVHALFAEVARRSPEAVALAWDGGSMTYAELDRRSRGVAARLGRAGVGPDEPVALAADRSPALIAAMLGILRAGGAFVPVNPHWPRARVAALLSDCGARVVLAPEEGGVALPPHALVVLPLEAEEDELYAGTAPDVEVGPTGAAYVMYTSGSTGRPKGVVVPHRAVVRLVRGSDFVVLGARETFLQLAPAAFDASTFEIWGALLNGGRLALFPPGPPSLEALGDFIRRHGVTTAWLTAGLFHQVVDGYPAALAPLRQLLAGGDALSVAHVRRALAAAPGVRLVNGYGPTENTTFSTCHVVLAGDAERASIPIGRPIPNGTAWVLDTGMRPVAVEVPGELYVGGDGLGRGYLAAPAATAARYLPDPFSAEPGARLYRTGDRVRWRADGTLEFLGRIDRQVKIRGYRIEPGEIESVLRQDAGVAEAVVHVREDAPGDRRLVAYVVPALSAPGRVEAESGGWDSGQVSRWEAVFDEMYQGGVPGGTGDPSLVGWNSSYTGERLPEEEMREWVESTVARILSLHPRRVLEIGVGSGLLLFRVAPGAEAYVGTDLSAETLQRVGARITAEGAALPVTLLQREAADFSALPAGRYDTVILNSVSQYFPSAAYLAEVVERGVETLEAGGAFFVGDVRNRRTLAAFRAAVEFDAARDVTPLTEVRERVRRVVQEEEELVVEPAFFESLGARLPRIAAVEVRLKRGRFHNEMTRHRFDVILRAAPSTPLPEAPAVHWDQARGTPETLRQALLARPTTPLAVLAIPDLRLERELRIAALLDAPDAPPTVGEARRRLGAAPSFALDPETLWALGEEIGCRVEIAPGERPGTMDVLFLPSGVEATLPAAAPDARGAEAMANDPSWGLRARELMLRLRAELAEQLPEFMVPSAIVPLPALPLNANGKVDRRALPPPGEVRSWEPGEESEPATEVERTLAEIFAEVLRLERIYTRDSFFELGGHSLLATQVVTRVREGFGIDLPLARLFEAPTVAALAEVVEAMQADAMAGLLDELEGLSEDEVRALLEAEGEVLGAANGE